MENLLSMLAGSYPYAGCGNAPVSCMDERFRPEPLDYAGRSPVIRAIEWNPAVRIRKNDAPIRPDSSRVEPRIITPLQRKLPRRFLVFRRAAKAAAACAYGSEGREEHKEGNGHV